MCVCVSERKRSVLCFQYAVRAPMIFCDSMKCKDSPCVHNVERGWRRALESARQKRCIEKWTDRCDSAEWVRCGGAANTSLCWNSLRFWSLRCEDMTVGLRADTWSKRRTRACAACTSMGREFLGERLGGVPRGQKVTVQQGQARRRIHGLSLIHISEPRDS